jgi:histone H3/H4
LICFLSGRSDRPSFPKRENTNGGERVNYTGKTLRDVAGTISTIVKLQDGSRFVQRLIDEGPDDTRRQIFDEIYPNAKTIMMDGFGNYVMQKLIDHANVDQMALLVPTLRDHISELSENKISNYPLQKIIQFVSKRINSPSLSEDVARRFRYFLEDLLEAIQQRMKELCCHQVGTRVVQCMVEHFPDSWKDRILRDLLRYFDDLATNYYGSFVLNDALKHCHEDFLESLATKIMTKLSDYSNDQYASIFVKYLLESKRFRVNLAWELINQNFRGNDTSAAVRLLNSNFGHQVLKKLITSCEEDQRKAIQSFVDSHRDELNRTQHGSVVLSSLYDAVNHRGPPASSGYGAPPPSSAPPSYGGDYGRDRDRERERGGGRSRSRERYAPPPPLPPSTSGGDYGHKRKRSPSRSPHRSDSRRDDYRGRDPYYPDPYYPPPPPSYDYDRRRRL